MRLSAGAVRRAWAALGRGSWTSQRLVTAWARVVAAEGFWQPHQHGGYHPVAVDITGFARPRLQGCPIRHYSATAGKAVPAIPLGIIAQVGSMAGQRFGVPLGLVLPDAAPGSPTFTIVAITDPASTEPLLVATPLALAPEALRELYRDRWPVEQLPLAAKQLLGTARQFVHEQETCQRFPELALLAGAVLTYAAATSPAVPTGAWDRQPRRTPGRHRRLS